MYCFISHSVNTLCVLCSVFSGEEEKDGVEKEADKKEGEKDAKTCCVCCGRESDYLKKEGEKDTKVCCVCCSKSSEDSTKSSFKV